MSWCPLGVWSHFLGFGQCFFLFLSLFSLGLCCCAWVFFSCRSRATPLVVAHRLSWSRHVESSQTRDGTWVRCIGRADSSPLDYQGESTAFLLKLSLLTRSPGGDWGKGVSKCSLFLLRVKERKGVCVCVCACAPSQHPQRSHSLNYEPGTPPFPIAMTTASYEDIGSRELWCGVGERHWSQAVSDRRTLW